MTPAEKLAKQLAKKPQREGKFARVWQCNVRAVREELGLSMRDIEKACGVKSSTVCRIERGQELSLSTAITLAKFFGKSIEELWEAQP